MAVACAIAKRPAVLLCDEPTGVLDSATGVRVLQALEQVNAEMGATTVIITHNADIARMASRVLWMQDGQKEESEETFFGGTALQVLEGVEGHGGPFDHARPRRARRLPAAG